MKKLRTVTVMTLAIVNIAASNRDRKTSFLKYLFTCGRKGGPKQKESTSNVVTSSSNSRSTTPTTLQVPTTASNNPSQSIREVSSSPSQSVKQVRNKSKSPEKMRPEFTIITNDLLDAINEPLTPPTNPKKII